MYDFWAQLVVAARRGVRHFFIIHQVSAMSHFAPEEIAEIWDRLRAGQSVRSVAIGLSPYPRAVQQLIKRSGGVPPLGVKSCAPHNKYRHGCEFITLITRRSYVSPMSRHTT